MRAGQRAPVVASSGGMGSAFRRALYGMRWLCIPRLRRSQQRRDWQTIFARERERSQECCIFEAAQKPSFPPCLPQKNPLFQPLCQWCGLQVLWPCAVFLFAAAAALLLANRLACLALEGKWRSILMSGVDVSAVSAASVHTPAQHTASVRERRRLEQVRNCSKRRTHAHQMNILFSKWCIPTPYGAVFDFLKYTYRCPTCTHASCSVE